MCIRSASSPSTVLWAFHTIQPSSFTKYILGTRKFTFERCRTFSPKSAWHHKIEILLTSFIVSFEQFMKKRLITKSSNDRYDFTSGQASKPYNNEGRHLLNNSCNTTSSKMYVLVSDWFTPITWDLWTPYSVLKVLVIHCQLRLCSKGERN